MRCTGVHGHSRDVSRCFRRIGTASTSVYLRPWFQLVVLVRASVLQAMEGSLRPGATSPPPGSDCQGGCNHRGTCMCRLLHRGCPDAQTWRMPVGFTVAVLPLQAQLLLFEEMPGANLSSTSFPSSQVSLLIWLLAGSVCDLFYFWFCRRRTGRSTGRSIKSQHQQSRPSRVNLLQRGQQPAAGTAAHQHQ